MRFNELLYDAAKGTTVHQAATLTLKYGFGGFCFNGWVIRRDFEDKIPEDLTHKYYQKVDGRGTGDS
jgi:hypothetical protein